MPSCESCIYTFFCGYEHILFRKPNLIYNLNLYIVYNYIFLCHVYINFYHYIVYIYLFFYHVHKFCLLCHLRKQFAQIRYVNQNKKHFEVKFTQNYFWSLKIEVKFMHWIKLFWGSFNKGYTFGAWSECQQINLWNI